MPAYERIDPSSAEYQEFARLYQFAQQIRPSARDGWNGELYARHDKIWGSVRTSADDGHTRAGKRLVTCGNAETACGGRVTTRRARRSLGWAGLRWAR